MCQNHVFGPCYGTFLNVPLLNRMNKMGINAIGLIDLHVHVGGVVKLDLSIGIYFVLGCLNDYRMHKRLSNSR